MYVQCDEDVYRKYILEQRFDFLQSLIFKSFSIILLLSLNSYFPLTTSVK